MLYQEKSGNAAYNQDCARITSRKIGIFAKLSLNSYNQDCTRILYMYVVCVYYGFVIMFLMTARLGAYVQPYERYTLYILQKLRACSCHTQTNALMTEFRRL
jgi:hypothetical protein